MFLGFYVILCKLIELLHLLGTNQQITISSDIFVEMKVIEEGYINLLIGRMFYCHVMEGNIFMVYTSHHTE